MHKLFRTVLAEKNVDALSSLTSNHLLVNFWSVNQQHVMLLTAPLSWSSTEGEGGSLGSRRSGLTLE